MDASGCLEENEKGVEKKKRKRSKATSIRLFDAEAVLGSIFATLFSHRELFRSRKALAHPREFAPVGWTSRNAFVYATARLSSRFSSLSLSLSPLPPPFIPPEREQVFTRPPENVETQSTPKYLPVRDRSSPFFSNLVLSTRAWWLLGIFVLRSFDHIYMYDHESRIVYGHHLLQSGWNWRRALQFLAWFLFLLVEPTSFHAINHTFKARSWRTFEG